MSNFYKIHIAPFIKKYLFIILGSVLMFGFLSLFNSWFYDEVFAKNSENGFIQILRLILIAVQAFSLPIITILASLIFYKRTPANQSLEKIKRVDVFLIGVSIANMVLFNVGSIIREIKGFVLVFASVQISFMILVLLIDYFIFNKKKNYATSRLTVIISLLGFLPIISYLIIFGIFYLISLLTDK